MKATILWPTPTADWFSLKRLAGASRRGAQIRPVTLVNEKNRNNLPRFERLQTLDMDGVRIRQTGTVTDVYLNLLADGHIRHRNANATIEGWETDAYLMALTFPEGADTTNFDAASSFLIADGSYLRRDGKVLFDSLSKVFMTETSEGKNVKLLLQGQPNINAMLRSRQKPSSVELNGTSIEVPYDASAQTLTARVESKAHRTSR